MGKINVAPLSGGYMLTSLVGIIVSGFWVYNMSKPWGATFLIFFMMMLVASIVSMTYYPGELKS